MRTRGFTLVELVLVTALITVLAGIVIYALGRYSHGPRAAKFLQMSKVYATALREAVQNNPNFRGRLPITRGPGTLPLAGALAMDPARAEIAISFDLLLTAERIVEYFSEIPYGGMTRPALAVTWNPATRAFLASPDVPATVAALPATVTWQRIESRLSDPTLSPDVAQGANFLARAGVPLPAQVVVVYWRLPAVPQAFAEELARKANGFAPVPGAACTVGPVAYAAPANGFTDAYLYIGHH